MRGSEEGGAVEEEASRADHAPVGVSLGWDCSSCRRLWDGTACDVASVGAAAGISLRDVGGGISAVRTTDVASLYVALLD